MNDNRVLAIGKMEQQIHLHSAIGRTSALDPATLSGEIQGFADRVALFSVNECPGKWSMEPRVLPYNHGVLLEKCDGN
jgi:hypothetical protein